MCDFISKAFGMGQGSLVEKTYVGFRCYSSLFIVETCFELPQNQHGIALKIC